ncbi:MAG: hypothetical protein WAU01_08150 [Saprospiraceae bacterium]
MGDICWHPYGSKVKDISEGLISGVGPDSYRGTDLDHRGRRAKIDCNEFFMLFILIFQNVDDH